MAADGLIEQYLVAFAERLGGRRDRTDLIDEVADHLYSASERLEALGVDRTRAEQRALARFGEPRLVAGLISSVPTKGNIMSLFLSRRLGALAAVTAALWLVATVAGVLGNSELAGGWTQERYLVSSIIIAVACLSTTAVLVGVNIRAVGRADAPTRWITAIGVFAAVAAGMLSWVMGLWMLPLTVAVVWTLLRVRRNHAGSPVFTTVMLIVLPIATFGAVAGSVVALTTDIYLDPLAWTTFLGLMAVLVAGFADLAVRLSHRSTVRRAAVG